jgi:hypothetical protein
VTQQKQAAPQLPDVDSAFNTVVNQVANSVFFHKLAAAGITPRSDEEARLILETSYKLASLNEQAQAKAAAENDSPFATLNKAADSLMERYGLAGVKAAAVHENECRSVSQAFAQHPEIYSAMLSLKVADANRSAA